jgi:hypothetical protein
MIYWFYQNKNIVPSPFLHNDISYDNLHNNFVFSALKHSPSKKGKKDSALRRISTVKQTNAGNTTSSATADSGKVATLSDEVNVLSEKASNLDVTAAVTKLESTTSSSPNGELIMIYYIARKYPS